MKMNLKTALVLVGALALCSAPLFAANAHKSAKEKGIIKQVDSATHQIVVSNQKAKTEGTFQWNAQTKFTENGKTVNADALKAGMRVHLAYIAGTATPMLEVVKLSTDKGGRHASMSHSSHRKS
jgi:hypothetical protein